MTSRSDRWCRALLCCGPLAFGCSQTTQMRGQANGLGDIVKQAKDNGAKWCAPRELALAESHLKFALIELEQGSPSDASRHLWIAEPNARAALALSPRDKCAFSGDRDGDGLIDTLDKCPDQPENYNGYLDEDGYLHFVDRIKDYIRRRAENISSFEVERSVNAHPKVSESAAIGVKSEQAEDEVKIVVVLKEGEKLPPEELLAFCEERMPYFAVPRYVEFVEKLPKTPTDRVQKNLLREMGLTSNTWDREKAGYKIKK